MFSQIKLVLCFGLLTFTVGCSNLPGMYKTDIYQGNFVSNERLDNVELGMTQPQVQLILGTPLVKDTFNEDIWYYVFSHYKSDETQQAFQDIRVHFDKNNKVSHIEVVENANLTEL